MNKIFLFLIFFLIPFFLIAADKVEINTASLGQLDEITGIGPVIGQRIIDARPFSSVDDLLRVKGIGEKTLQKIKEQGLACVGEKQEETRPPENLPAEAGAPPVGGASSGEVGSLVNYPGGIIFNEILPSPEGADEDGEWVEIQNTNNFEVDLSGWKIEDIEGTKTAYVFAGGTKILASGYLVFKRPETKITLNNSADGLNLFWPDGSAGWRIIDSVNFQSAPKNQSYNRNGNLWIWSQILTPGAKNTISQPKTEANNILPKSEISDNNNVEAGLASLSRPGIANPWFLFFTALTITIVSAVIILIIKFKLKNVRT